SGLSGEPITVWGKGNRRNQYTYVADIASAVGALIGRRSEARGSTYNLVSSTVTTTSELAQLVASATGAKVRYLLDRPEAPTLPYVDSTKARRQIDWAETPLVDGVRATIGELRKLAPVK
ncbi:MAG: hypothetical protein M3R54_07665, partial [Chloroflexota bacterium]|nr:hypothetical protein [Chloroflexota bacterium]